MWGLVSSPSQEEEEEEEISISGVSVVLWVGCGWWGHEKRMVGMGGKKKSINQRRRRKSVMIFTRDFLDKKYAQEGHMYLPRRH
jgi:hypothetical protein